VMLHVNALVKNLAEANGDLFHSAEQAIQQRRTEVGIVNEVVGNAVDVPRNADGINKTENQHDPEWHARKKVKHPEEVSAVKNGRSDGNDVPACVRKNPRICLRPIDWNEVSRSWHSFRSRIGIHNICV
jgi:hypothetical protein